MHTAWDRIPQYRPYAGARITHTDSLENKVLEFFDRNPDEDLTISDAAIKFDADQTHTSRLFKTMFERGLLSRHRKGGARFQWSYCGVCAAGGVA